VNDKANPTAFRGILGFDVHPNVALELMVAGGGSDDQLDKYIDVVEIKSSYGVFVKPKYALDNNFEVFGRIGYAKTKGTMTEPGFQLSVNESDLAWGLGASYKFSKQWYGSADYMSYFSKDGVKVDGFALNVGYRF
jgi:opacity protein-like surface antigen